MKPMETHVKIVGVLHIVWGALGILIGVAVSLFFGGIAGLVRLNGDSNAATAVPILGAIGGLVLAVLFAVSIPGVIAGVGVLSFKPWARILMIVLSVLDLLSFPFGTALGVYGLWVLLAEDGARLFENRRSYRPPAV